ncbi:MAG: hypothetical protein M3Q29_14015 [Chloroflexota bacterium]|nr:hypothetical protein [Chloroflexota bacterium]
MQRGQAPHKAVTSAKANKDVAEQWRLLWESSEERCQDLERELETVRAQYAQLHSGYKSALARLYVALDKQHA